MRILIAGGVFRLTREDRALRQPAPEVLLVDGLREHGIDAVECQLENLVKVGSDRTFDLIHVHHLSKAALVASLSPLARPFIFTEHGIPSGHTSRVQRVRQIIYHRASATVCLSERERSTKINEFGLHPDRAWTIPNPASLSGYQPELRKANSDSFILLYVGQLIELKQVDRIIKALSELPKNVRLRLVYHNETLRHQLFSLAESLDVLDRVEFVGQLSGSELTQSYRQAGALILPSEHEALPSVVTEALMTGLPVIASDVGGIPEQILNAGILVSPDPKVSLVEPINQLLAQYNSYAQFAFTRSKSIGNDFGMAQALYKHIQMYKAVLESKVS